MHQPTSLAHDFADPVLDLTDPVARAQPITPVIYQPDTAGANDNPAQRRQETVASARNAVGNDDLGRRLVR